PPLFLLNVSTGGEAARRESVPAEAAFYEVEASFARRSPPISYRGKAGAGDSIKMKVFEEEGEGHVEEKRGGAPPFFRKFPLPLHIFPIPENS
ncbi:hypothetical protein, partial [uncultured Bilophila sp.]